MTATTFPVIDVTVAVGTTLRFEKDAVISASVIQEINPVSVELPISTLEFKVINTYAAFTMFSGETYELLSQRLPVMVYESVGGSNHFIGKFYLQSWKNVSDTEIEFTAIDIIGVLADTDFDGYFFSASTTLPDVMAAIFVPADVSYTIDASLETVELSGWIPPGTYREALQQICFASGAMAKTAETSTLDLVPVVIPETSYDDEILDTEKSANQAVELLPLVTRIELVSHTYTPGTELETLYEAYLEPGTYKIVFNDPYYVADISGGGYTGWTLSTEGGDDLVLESGDYLEIGGEYASYTAWTLALENEDDFALESGDYLEIGGGYAIGSNSLYFEATSAGTVTVTGYKWFDNKRSFTFNEAVSVEFQNKNSKTIPDATLIGLDNAAAILEQLRDYYRLRYKQNMRLFDSTIDVGTIVLTSTIQEKEVIGTILRRNLSLTGGNLADVELLGIEYEEA